MEIKKLILYINTLKYLKPIQVYYRLYYFFRNRFFLKNQTKSLNKEPSSLKWSKGILNIDSLKKNKKFIFLNIEHQFKEEIDWNIDIYGKLWTYNLNYFDYLNQQSNTAKEGLELINTYIKKSLLLKDGKEPYPISLRGINWIKFLSKNKIKDQKINQYLYADYQNLLYNLEYHLLGNHLLENGFSLYFAAYYFDDKQLYKKAKKILINQLNEQILTDGAHFELSPMYHQIVLHRVLDCINLIQLNTKKKDDLFLFLIEKAKLMLSWLQEITYKNGEIPMLNDSTNNIAPSSNQLFKYAEKIGLKWKVKALSTSGYRKVNVAQYELIIDIGNIKANYQPGHTHSDLFNFELYVKNKPFIVDTGISTYEKNNLRNQQRSTKAHNTVQVNNLNQTEVWGGFRVARRAKSKIVEETNKSIKVTHNGYKKVNIIHQRKFEYQKKIIVITDQINGQTNQIVRAFLHFHPTINIAQIKNNTITFNNNETCITFDSQEIEIVKEKYEYCIGFNKTEKATKITIIFTNKLTTKITLYN